MTKTIRIVLIAAASAASLLCWNAPAPSADPAKAGPLLIKDATILTVSHGTIPKGSILVRDGKIAEVGPTVAAPADATVIDAGRDVRAARHHRPPFPPRTERGHERGERRSEFDDCD